tara:strand:+ start:13180 stop:13524 length:345 start_codon:yes stop_codon:yes gene_type:complete
MVIPFIFKHSRIPRLFSWAFNVEAIALFPFIFVRGEGNKTILRHEMIHIRQQFETAIVGFYLIYLFDFIISLWKYKNFIDAYKSIRFEREAYTNQYDEHYLKYRPAYAWRKYKL